MTDKEQLTIPQAKEIIAQKWGLSSFERLRKQGRPDMESFYDSVSEHYGNWCREDEMNKWKKTIDGQRLKLSEQDKEISELREKLEAAEEIYQALINTGLKRPNIIEALNKYNNLKP
jgi:hypothetical protein